MSPRHHLRRRAFLSGAGASLIATPSARAQQRRVVRLALVSTGTPIEQMTERGEERFQALFRELRSLGHIEGGDLSVTRWSTAGLPEQQWGELAHEIVASAPDIIVAGGQRLLLALKNATSSIPIVFSAADPVAGRLVDSLARPGGNLTGFSGDAGPGLSGKRVQFLHELAPAMTRLAYLNTPLGGASTGEETREAARRFGLEYVPVFIEGSVTEVAVKRVLWELPDPLRVGVMVANGTEFLGLRAVIAATALERRIATAGQGRDLAEAGCLLTYGHDFNEQYRALAGYVDRILKGAKPADLPVQQPREFELVINKRTADALGLKIPEHLLVFATEIIE
jgi:putative tryptophan/tyrosine transport system substrate-binding protein